MTQLRFDDNEITHYFKEACNLTLSAPQLTKISQQTDGWGGSLQILALRLQASRQM